MVINTRVNAGTEFLLTHFLARNVTAWRNGVLVTSFMAESILLSLSFALSLSHSFTHKHRENTKFCVEGKNCILSYDFFLLTAKTRH